jgi:hypothetical protein
MKRERLSRRRDFDDRLLFGVLVWPSLVCQRMMMHLMSPARGLRRFWRLSVGCGKELFPASPWGNYYSVERQRALG